MRNTRGHCNANNRSPSIDALQQPSWIKCGIYDIKVSWLVTPTPPAIGQMLIDALTGQF